ncbi:MAG: hypothetical protein Q4F60_01630 [Candidatus Saccharibacteria bacterium]|nr:hypothetical protein [Candidatus Saccharibacteria bacterium]
MNLIVGALLILLMLAEPSSDGNPSTNLPTIARIDDCDDFIKGEHFKTSS